MRAPLMRRTPPSRRACFTCSAPPATRSSAASRTRARGGLTRDALRDSAAWLRRLARRFEEPLSKPKTLSLNQGDFERDFLGVSAELRALARAAEALAAHDVTTSEEEPERRSIAIRPERETMKTKRFLNLRKPRSAPSPRGAWRFWRAARRTRRWRFPWRRLPRTSLPRSSSPWRSRRSPRRAAAARARALVDALAPALEAAAAFELAVAGALAKAVAVSGDLGENPGPTKESVRDKARDEMEGAIAALRDAQDWRLRLEALARSTPARAMRRGEDGSPPTRRRRRTSPPRTTCSARRWARSGTPPRGAARATSTSTSTRRFEPRREPRCTRPTRTKAVATAATTPPELRERRNRSAARRKQRRPARRPPPPRSRGRRGGTRRRAPTLR